MHTVLSRTSWVLSGNWTAIALPVMDLVSHGIPHLKSGYMQVRSLRLALEGMFLTAISISVKYLAAHGNPAPYSGYLQLRSLRLACIYLTAIHPSRVPTPYLRSL